MTNELIRAIRAACGRHDDDEPACGDDYEVPGGAMGGFRLDDSRFADREECRLAVEFEQD